MCVYRTSCKHPDRVKPGLPPFGALLTTCTGAFLGLTGAGICNAQAVQQGGVEGLWDEKPSPSYIIDKPSADWILSDDHSTEATGFSGSTDASNALEIVHAETVETRLTPYADASATSIEQLNATSARDQYVRVYFALRTREIPVAIRLGNIQWKTAAPPVGEPHKRVVHFGPVAVERTQVSDKRYRMAPLWLEATTQQDIAARQQSVWMLQWWIAPNHPAGKWEGTLPVQYRTGSDANLRSKSLRVNLEILPVNLDRLPSDRARYGVWYGPTWRYTNDASYQKHFAEMREAGINQLGMMNVSADSFRYETGEFKFEPGRVEDVARRFREAVRTGSLFVDLRMITGYASIFGRTASELTSQGASLPPTLPLEPKRNEDLYAMTPVQNSYTQMAYTLFAQKIKQTMDAVPGSGDVYYFPQEEPSTRKVRQLIMNYFGPLTVQAGLPLVLVTSAGLTGADDTKEINTSINLISANFFDAGVIEKWRLETRPVEFYNIGENLRFSSGFFLHYFPVPIRGLTIWAYQFGNPISDADTKRGGVYAPVHFLTYPGDKGPVPTLRWIEYSEGITDRRYVYTVERQLEQLKRKGGDAKQLEKELSELRSTFNRLIPRDLKSYKETAPAISSSELDSYRQRYIDLLRKSLTSNNLKSN